MLIEKAFRSRKKLVRKTWRMDETSIKAKGESIGKQEAFVFKSALGITSSGASLLKKEIINGLRNNECKGLKIIL